MLLSQTGALTISGALRANYQDKNYGEDASDHKIQFDAAILRLGYESPDWFGKFEYRCYQYDTFCDFSTLVYGYAGYHLNSTDNITVGVQPIPFGPGRFFTGTQILKIRKPQLMAQEIHGHYLIVLIIKI
ncbi:hypothetical protein ASC84_19780 [Acinetobacter sp. Root1280]|nr:hypothetical protein ASC84_19780 [Acinetobacter sp. Root1280]